MKFAPEYVANVLNENFEDAKELLLSPLMAIHYAHLVMLAEQGIIPAADARALRAALDGISLDSIRKVLYDGTYEDLFFYIERLIEQACGEDVAGRLHTARSRNDIDMTMYRMRQREFIAALAAATLELRGGADRARRAPHRHGLRRAHAYAAGAADDDRALPAGGGRTAGARRDASGGGVRIHQSQSARRLRDHRHRVSRSIATAPASCSGSAARPATPTAASPPSTTCSRACGATSVLIVGLGRVVQDLLLWCTMEFGYLRLGDGFVQGSSIMPQKRNPVALEHARAIGSKAVGQAQAITTAVHNTPFGDIVDTEDDLQPLVASMFRDAIRDGDARSRGHEAAPTSMSNNWRRARDRLAAPR